MSSIYKYRRITTEGPNGTTLQFHNDFNDNYCLELCEINGITYVFVTNENEISIQPPEINFEKAVIDEKLRQEIIENSRACFLLREQQQLDIRSVYSEADEWYFSRIASANAIGVYAFKPGEKDSVISYNNFIELKRQWLKDSYSKIGL